MIPKIIHYCWFGSNPLPLEAKKCIDSWKKYAPDFEIIEWNESNFDVYSHPFIESAYNNKAWAFVSDYVRLKVVYDYGGIYFDTDVELLRNPDFLLENECFVGVQQNGNFCNTGLGFGAVKFSLIIGEMIKKYDDLIYSEEIKITIACPILNNDVLKSQGYVSQVEIWKNEVVTVYPPRYFDPLTSGRGSNLLCGDTVSIHHYSASWLDRKTRLKRKIARIVGEENILAIKKALGGKDE